MRRATAAIVGPRLPWMDRSSVVQGYVGGQEDMIIDIALQLAEERDAAGDKA